MICFRDMTFCAATERCGTAECPRRWDDAQRVAAQAWWGGDNAPVAFADFSDRACFSPAIRQATGDQE